MCLAPFSGNFNSQPHEEADDYDREWVFDKFISTRSLTRRLTPTLSHGGCLDIISTRSLTRRLTQA